MNAATADTRRCDLPALRGAHKRVVLIPQAQAAQLRPAPAHLLHAQWLNLAYGPRDTWYAFDDSAPTEPFVLLGDDHPAFPLMALAHVGRVKDKASDAVRQVEQVISIYPEQSTRERMVHPGHPLDINGRERTPQEVRDRAEAHLKLKRTWLPLPERTQETSREAFLALHPDFDAAWLRRHQHPVKGQYHFASGTLTIDWRSLTMVSSRGAQTRPAVTLLLLAGEAAKCPAPPLRPTSHALAQSAFRQPLPQDWHRQLHGRGKHPTHVVTWPEGSERALLAALPVRLKNGELKLSGVWSVPVPQRASKSASPEDPQNLTEAHEQALKPTPAREARLRRRPT